MYKLKFKTRTKDGLYITVKKQISNWSYIVEVKKLDQKGRIIQKAVKVVEKVDLDSGDIDIFIDSNKEKKPFNSRSKKNDK